MFQFSRGRSDKLVKKINVMSCIDQLFICNIKITNQDHGKRRKISFVNQQSFDDLCQGLNILVDERYSY